MGFFDGLPIPPDKSYLREELAKIDEGWSAARFDSLPHVVHILTSKDREGGVQYLKEQNDVVEDVVDEVVHAYHGGFNKAIQNYSQILRLFSESAESIKTLKIDLAEAQKCLGARNKQLHQLWYRSVTLRHIIALLDQIESISKVPARIEKLIAEKQFYAAVQVHVQSALMLDREGLQTVGALQDIRSELSKLRGVLFYQILEELHLHLYNKGKYRWHAAEGLQALDLCHYLRWSNSMRLYCKCFSFSSCYTQLKAHLLTLFPMKLELRKIYCYMLERFHFSVPSTYHPKLSNNFSSIVSSRDERDDELPTTTAVVVSMSNSQSLSRRTRLMRGDNQLVDGTYRPGSIDGSSFDGHDEESSLELNDEIDGNSSSMRNGDVKIVPRLIPSWLSSSNPDEFVEAIRKSDAPEHVKYLQTMVECLCMLGKVAAADAVISQRLRATIHDIITSKIKLQAQLVNSLMPASSHLNGTKAPQSMKDHLDGIKFSKNKRQSGTSVSGTLSSVSPVSPVMSPSGKAQTAAKELLDSILDTVVKILENHVIVGEMLESKFSQNVNMNTPRSLTTDAKINIDSEASQATGGFSIGFSLTVFQSECQQLICEILRATPEAASADSVVQTARLPSKGPSKEKKEGSEDGLAFSFRFTDATVSVSNQGSDLVRQGWSRRGPSVSQEGYGSAAVLPEQGIYLAASIYRPILQFSNKVAALIPKQYSSLGSDALLTFMEKFVKDHFLPTMFGDYRKGVQQAISSPAAFRPRAHPSAIYTSSVEKGRPILQGLLAINFLAKEVLGWARAMPKFSNDLVKFVQSFLERTYERCRTSYMEAVLEKQSYMLIGRHDIEKLMRLDPESACLPHSLGPRNSVNRASDIESIQIESELNDLLLNLRPIRQENLIRDDNKLILLACLSDSLEYIAESMERLSQSLNQVEEDGKSLASFADDYRKLAIDCLKVMRIEMQLETIFYLQDMTNRGYLDDQDAEEPDDFIVSLTAQITRRDEEMAPFVEGVKRNYIFGGICGIAANASIKALTDMRSINLFGVQQIFRNSIALEQALAAIPSIDSESVLQRLDHVRTYYELLNMPFEALLAFITEHEHLYTASEYANLLKVQVPGREVPPGALDCVSDILSH